jgi:hypothetical protein
MVSGSSIDEQPLLIHSPAQQIARLLPVSTYSNSCLQGGQCRPTTNLEDTVPARSDRDVAQLCPRHWGSLFIAFCDSHHEDVKSRP